MELSTLIQNTFDQNPSLTTTVIPVKDANAVDVEVFAKVEDQLVIIIQVRDHARSQGGVLIQVTVHCSVSCGGRVHGPGA